MGVKMKSKFKFVKIGEKIAEFECKDCGSIILIQQNSDILKYPDKCSCEWE